MIRLQNDPPEPKKISTFFHWKLSRLLLHSWHFVIGSKSLYFFSIFDKLKSQEVQTTDYELGCSVVCFATMMRIERFEGELAKVIGSVLPEIGTKLCCLASAICSNDAVVRVCVVQLAR